MINVIIGIGIISLLIVGIINQILNILVGKSVRFSGYNNESIYECGLTSYYLIKELKVLIIRYYLIILIFIIFEIEIAILYRMLYCENKNIWSLMIFIVFIILGVVLEIKWKLI